MEKQREENGRSPRKRIVNILVHVFLAVLAVIWVMPIFWIVLTSFRAEPGAYTSTFLPKAYTLNNYIVRAVCVVFAQPDAFQIP